MQLFPLRMLELALATLLATALVSCAQEPLPNEIRASGHVEAIDVRLAPEVGGRIVMLAVNEGDRVKPESVILRLDGRDIELSVQRARAEHDEAAAQLRSAEAGGDPELVAQAHAEAQRARDELTAARAALAAAEAVLQRHSTARRARAPSRQQRDAAATRRDAARATVQTAESRVVAADREVTALRSTARPEQVATARARVEAAATQLATAEESLKRTMLRSPINGIVTRKLVAVGEVIAPRSPVVVITDVEKVWADVFVAEPVVPRIRVGQMATVFTDAGGSGIAGTVSHISTKGEFTPRDDPPREERSKLVYRVRVSVPNPDGVLKPGMPVEALIPLQAQQ